MLFYNEKKKIVFKNSIETKVFTLDEFFNKMVYSNIFSNHTLPNFYKISIKTRDLARWKNNSLLETIPKKPSSLSLHSISYFSLKKKRRGWKKLFKIIYYRRESFCETPYTCSNKSFILISRRVSRGIEKVSFLFFSDRRKIVFALNVFRSWWRDSVFKWKFVANFIK